MNIDLMNLQAEYESNEENIKLLEKRTVEDRAYLNEMQKKYPYPLLQSNKQVMAMCHLCSMRELDGLIELQQRYDHREYLKEQIKEMEDALR